MTTEEEKIMLQQQEQMLALSSTLDGERLSSQQKEALAEQMRSGLVKEQLDLDHFLNDFENLLHERVRVFEQATGVYSWSEPEDETRVILSKRGILKLMNFIRSYVNKNTLLSNFSEEQINNKMLDLGETLADDIYMDYQFYFNFLTLEQMKVRLEAKLSRQAKEEVVTIEIKGREADYEQILRKVKDECDVPKQIEIIRKDDENNKLKSFAIIVQKILDMVHASLMRAYQSGERTSLRKNMSINEMRNPDINNPKDKNINALKFFKKT